MTAILATCLTDPTQPVTSLRAECVCFNPTLSTEQNEAYNQVRTWREEAAGWPTGKKENE